MVEGLTRSCMHSIMAQPARPRSQVQRATALQAGQAARRARQRPGGSAHRGVHARRTAVIAGTPAAVTAGNTGSRGSRGSLPAPTRAAVVDHGGSGLSSVSS